MRSLVVGKHLTSIVCEDVSPLVMVWEDMSSSEVYLCRSVCDACLFMLAIRLCDEEERVKVGQQMSDTQQLMHSLKIRNVWRKKRLWYGPLFESKMCRRWYGCDFGSVRLLWKERRRWVKGREGAKVIEEKGELR